MKNKREKTRGECRDKKKKTKRNHDRGRIKSRGKRGQLK